MKTIVITNNRVVGFHAYPNAPKEVDFLRNVHRHEFLVECGFPVEHDDRDIEIFLKQAEIDKFLASMYGSPAMFGAMSCEMIAKKLLIKFNCEYVKVLEDGNGGAIVQR